MCLGLQNRRLAPNTDLAPTRGDLLDGKGNAEHMDDRAELPPVSARDKREFVPADGTGCNVHVKDGHDSN